jgi:iron complex outermembrane recepter protein
MKFTFTKGILAPLLLMFLAHLGFSQSVVKGKIIDGTSGEVLVGATVVLKGTTTGSQTDYDGLFEFKTTQIPPFTLSVSFIGFETKDIQVTDLKGPLSIKLGEETKLIDVVEIKGQRISDKQKAAPLTVESMDKLAIKQTASVSFYEGMGALKGVDMTTASIGFTIINTRGFNSTSPVRSLQVIDGVDNQSPGLNFSLGNFLGSSELDVLKADLIVGASSAYYGPNAFNGVLSMETKNPFFQKGLAVQVKTGERNLLEGAFRYADAFKNKQGNDWMAFKLNGFFMKAYDWVADNDDQVFKTDFSAKNAGGYDHVNRYGDEYNPTFDYSELSKKQPWAFPGLGGYARKGYAEKDLVDYNTKNIKANASVHFRLNPAQQENSTELILSSSFGNGTTVYQGDNRFSLRDILFFQNRIELRKRDKFFIRAYATNEDAGNTFDPYFTAQLLQEKSKGSVKWGSQYEDYWRNNILPRTRKLEFPQPTVVANPDGTFSRIFDFTKSDAWLAKYNDSIVLWHQQAQLYANTTQTTTPYYEPGTPQFKQAFDEITSKKSSKRDLINGGTRLFDLSALYHLHGEYKFTPTWTDLFTVGANVRVYRPYTEGTIFNDTVERITNSEFGVYGGFEKSFSDKKWKVSGTLRMDKNQNFGFLFSPAASLVWQPDKTNFLRLSFSSAIRNPTLADQYLNLNVGPAILSGNLRGSDSLYTVDDFKDYLNTQNRKKLEATRFVVPAIRPEKVKSLEVGYRTTLFNSTYMDASYYYSFYDDFIGYRIGVSASIDPITGFPGYIQAYRYAANSLNQVTTQGFSIGLSHYFMKYYSLSGNYSWNKLNTKVDDPIIPAFNTPEHKFNVSVSGRDVKIGKLENFGFNINYKWIQGFLFEGSPQFTGSVPTYSLLDAQINYSVPKINATFKLGASNLLNNMQFQTYGGPRIGRMAYFSILYDFTKKIQ